MIHIKITMNSGKEYLARNEFVDNVKDWMKNNFMPGGIQMKWFQYNLEEYLQISQIESIKEMSEKELEELINPPIEEDDSIESPTNDDIPESPEGEDDSN